uniref:EOG090X085S n=1 Tax=Lynceus sp. MCZ IZ 141354 TaxID=1930659 RepID=A0A9N6WSV2_9CRUS|nr:EOG090X085S [Lynceus sp. MCZ IZ 141354]
MGSCRDCMTRIPYATFIATVLCLIGIGVFCGTLYRGATLAYLIFVDVFHIQIIWIGVLRMVLVILAGIMGALAIIILIIGCLATGSTRQNVYRQWSARIKGRLSSAILLGISYVLFYLWSGILVCLTIVTFIFTMFWGLCSDKQHRLDRPCIDFTQFDWMFPNGTRVEDLQICGPEEIKMFCKDYVETAEVSFILATVACFIVSLSLVHYLMCLSANYAYIRDQEKISDLQEMQYLNDTLK